MRSAREVAHPASPELRRWVSQGFIGLKAGPGQYQAALGQVGTQGRVTSWQVAGGGEAKQEGSQVWNG